MAARIKRIDNWHLGPCICHHSVVSWPIIYVRVVCVSLVCLIPSEVVLWYGPHGGRIRALKSFCPSLTGGFTSNDHPSSARWNSIFSTPDPEEKHDTSTWNFALYNFHTSKVFKETGHETDDFPCVQSCAGDIIFVRWQRRDIAPHTPATHADKQDTGIPRIFTLT